MFEPMVNCAAEILFLIQQSRLFSAGQAQLCAMKLTMYHKIVLPAELEGLPEVLVMRALGVLEKSGKVTCASSQLPLVT